MEEINKDLILAEIPLFSDLTRWERRLIKKRSSFVEYKKNDIIYQEGAPADAFSCIVLGRVIMYTKGEAGKEVILECLHRGKYFGIISLLTGDVHSVTAKTINDCLILRIKKDDFDFILKKIPRLAINLSQTLSRRLKRKDIHQKIIFESTIISVLSSYSQAGKTIYASNLALSLRQESHKPVIILDIVPEERAHILPAKLAIDKKYPRLNLSSRRIDTTKALKDFILKSKFGIDLVCISYNKEDAISIKRLIDILSLLVNDYSYIVLDLPSLMHSSIFRIVNQSDLIHVLTSPEPRDLIMTHRLIKSLKKDLKFKESKIKAIINGYKSSKLIYGEQSKVLNHEIFATLPKIEAGISDRLILDKPDFEYSLVIRRIARQLGDSMVGLALGVGVAYGFCHIGVLKVIEEEKIPIDVISGSSIGALIAALWAIGKSSDEILEITKEFQGPRSLWRIMDFTFPWKGFIKGNKLYDFLKRQFGSKTFYDLKLSLKVVTSDVRKRESRILDKGLLADAIMMSCSMPGVFRPFKPKQEMLFDGGVVHPLPTEPLFKMGLKKIIAVNVTPDRSDIARQYDKMKKDASEVAGTIKARRWFNPGQYLKDKLKTNILDIIFSSIEIMQSEIAKEEAKLADVVLHPDTSGLYWLELHRAKEFAERGEIEARKHLDQIWQVIKE